MRCPVCGSKIADEAKFCPVCKTRLTDGDAEFACPMCGTLVDSNADICPSCGAEFAEDEEKKKNDIVPDKEEVRAEPQEALQPLVSEELEELVKLKGVGPLKAKVLFNAGYTDLRTLKSASVKELASIKGIGKKTAAQIKAELMKIDLDGIRSTELTAEDVEAERQCTLCGTILSAFETSCYECGMIFDKFGTMDAKDADIKALEFYEKKLHDNPSDTEAWYARGSTLVKLSRLREALASFDQVTGINPKYDGAWIAKADVFRKLGEPKMAADCYNKVISATGAINLLPKMNREEDETPVSQDELKEFDLELSQPLQKGGKDACSTCGEPIPKGAASCPVCGAGYSPMASEDTVSSSEAASASQVEMEAVPDASSPGESLPEPIAESSKIEEPLAGPLAPAETEPAAIEISPESEQTALAVQEAEQEATSELAPKVFSDGEPDVQSMDDKSLYHLLSESANELKPLLAIAKEQGIDVSDGRRQISEAVIYGKKKEVKRAVEIMLEGKKSVKGAMKLRFLREISSLENDVEELRVGGANVTLAVKHLKDAKECLKVGHYTEVPASLANARNDLAAFKKALGG